MEFNIQHCPNCLRVESDAYKKGYNDAITLLHRELELAVSNRPIQIIIKSENIKEILKHRT
jgi:hypothetical protein